MQQSRYSPIWNQLKETGVCRIAAPRCLHPRLIKAVIKRKDVDLEYKYQLAEQFKTARLEVAEDKGGAEIVFKLRFYLNVAGL